MKNILSKKVAKRFFISVGLGTLFGVICCFIISNSPIFKNSLFWFTPTMWFVFLSRFTLGVLVFISGAFIHHPIFGFRCFPAFRGSIMGVIAGLNLGVGSLLFSSENQVITFFGPLITSVIIGLIIDVIATKFSGEGIEIVKK